VRKKHVLRQEILGVKFSCLLKYRIFEGLYANFSDFISSLDLFYANSRSCVASIAVATVNNSARA